ncbi:glycoside hydrolase family 15 protein [Flavobacteriaceae bacterium]|nr:glycoside hydrolase family 15 protein [Flavobacteriaceae bacterium]
MLDSNNLELGIIGNCHSSALISKSASINWCCLPEFDSPSVFGKILDYNNGGSFEIICNENYNIQQQYLKNTCILVTKFSSGKNIFEVHDFMPRYLKKKNKYHSPAEIIRYFKLISGKPKFKIKYNPKLEYSSCKTETLIKDEFIVSITKKINYDSLYLYTDFEKSSVVNGSEIDLISDGYFLICYNEKIISPKLNEVFSELNRTNKYWINWCSTSPSFSEYEDEIIRSAMTLKLLTYDKTGAILAAVTTSIPETIGEVRNWDYRFCWIRDASMVIRVVHELGHKNVIRKYLEYIIDLIPDKGEKFQIMYGINREKELEEKKLNHLAGYKNSKPVRVGNAAFSQKQNDIYGILMDIIYTEIKLFSDDKDQHEQLWSITKNVAWVVNDSWMFADKGIWEFRGEDRHFTFSKVLCWVAIDRAIKVAELFNKHKKISKWSILRDNIKKDIFQNGWNDKKKSFTQSYNSSDLDASVLLMEPYGFIKANDPKYISTVHSIEKELSNDGLLFRYKNEDDFGLPSSSFTVCTFWFIDALNKIGERKKAKKLFDKLLSYSNHLGLFSEDLDFKTKELLGNFPQAYSHLALIETAMNLNKTKDFK